MALFADTAQWILGLVLILSSIGVVMARNPVHASLSFLLTLLALAALYLELSAQFIAAMQVLVYAGAILVIFMFVIVLFQDAHAQLEHFKAKSMRSLLIVAGLGFIGALVLLGSHLVDIPTSHGHLQPNFGTVQALGKALYLDFFFPFEAVILLFLVAVVGALYIGKKVDS